MKLLFLLINLICGVWFSTTERSKICTSPCHVFHVADCIIMLRLDQFFKSSTALNAGITLLEIDL